MDDGQLVGCRLFQGDQGILVELLTKKSPSAAEVSFRVFLFPDTATELAENILEAVKVWKETHHPSAPQKH